MYIKDGKWKEYFIMSYSLISYRQTVSKVAQASVKGGGYQRVNQLFRHLILALYSTIKKR